MFRRNHEGASARWNFIDPSLHVHTLLGTITHPYFRAVTATKLTMKATSVPWPLSFHAQGTSKHRCKRAGSQWLKAGDPPHTQPDWVPREYAIHGIRASAYSRGRATSPHICAVCEGSHPVKDCSRLQQDSPYRSTPRGSPGFA